MTSFSTSSLTTGFIDLATFDEQEKYMYGGNDATAYFVRETRKSTWFTQVPVVLSRASGQPGFNQEWSVSISRAGDYLLHVWLRVTIPAITAKSGFLLAWSRNLMHNLIRDCAITFNDLVAARFDNYHLDFWSAFTTPAGKLNGYKNMIGDISELCMPSASKQAVTLNLPLPFFFTRDSGVALPTAAIPYNDMKIQFAFRDWNQLLTAYSATASESNPDSGVPATSTHIEVAPVISSAQVWANYALVSNEERKRMACAPRDILIEQVQTAPVQTFNSSNATTYDLRFSHAIKLLLFAVRNKTVASSWSNYTYQVPKCSTPSTAVESTDCSVVPLDFNDCDFNDPIKEISLIYENSHRLSAMGCDYFSLVQPWYHAPVIPQETGYHMYSYSLDFICLDPMGSTNFGKLTNVSLLTVNSTLPEGLGSYSGDIVVTAVNNNIIRISGGAVGFPVL